MTHEGLLTGSEVCWEPLPENRLRFYGWTNRELRVGDYLILRPRHEDRTTRYRLTKYERFRDPYDMWVGEGEFAPR